LIAGKEKDKEKEENDKKAIKKSLLNGFVFQVNRRQQQKTTTTNG